MNLRDQMFRGCVGSAMRTRSPTFGGDPRPGGSRRCCRAFIEIYGEVSKLTVSWECTLSCHGGDLAVERLLLRGSNS
ncbi:hypothetical protein EVAR_87098_1 [Eumeta japonica]|uniref:Uncharacterized protein n=1 Tax=Eumeta variegata TaxID=151549 RepID=A0A4C1VSQ4_EUMVA|nr:hypothetical protein EVAR_87098_1 [Eumeta japonica]